MTEKPATMCVIAGSTRNLFLNIKLIHSKFNQMKKYIYTTLILTILGLQGCSDKDIRTCKGEIHHRGNTYQLSSARKTTPMIETGVSLDDVFFNNYFLPLIFTGKDRNTFAAIIVRSKSGELQSGEFHLSWIGVTHRDNGIQINIDLADDFVHFSRNFGQGTKMKLSITEERDGIFNIELRQADGKGDFFITYRGLVPETWN